MCTTFDLWTFVCYFYKDKDLFGWYSWINESIPRRGRFLKNKHEKDKAYLTNKIPQSDLLIRRVQPTGNFIKWLLIVHFFTTHWIFGHMVHSLYISGVSNPVSLKSTFHFPHDLLLLISATLETFSLKRGRAGIGGMIVISSGYTRLFNRF